MSRLFLLSSPFRSGLQLMAAVGFAAALSGCSQGTGTRTTKGLDPADPIPEVPWNPPTSVPSGTPAAEYGKLSVNGTHLVNEAGEAVQLKGVSSMWLNWESKRFAEDKVGVGWLRDNWNLRVIRAAMGVEAAGGYLTNRTKAESQVRAIVRNAIDLGIYVIIDWHDHHAHLNVEKAEDFFSRMAEEFGQYPNVIYEPFNEPECVEADCQPRVMLQWPQLKEYHERIVAAIRAKDPDNVIILGTPTWSQEVDKAAADPVVGTNLMYTLHFYSCTHTQWLINRADEALQAGLPLFVTEWGATNADGGIDQKVCLDTAQDWHDWMNTNYVSWAAWKFDICSDSSCFFGRQVATTGGWTDMDLAGHGPFVRDRMSESAPPRSLNQTPSDSGAPSARVDAATLPTTPVLPDSGQADATLPQSEAGASDAASDAQLPDAR